MLETVNALSATATRDLAWRLVQLIRQEPRIEIISSSGELLDKGLELFRGRPDKDWSLTDCISFVVMQERGLTEALTADHRFEQAGFRALLDLDLPLPPRLNGELAYNCPEG